MVPHIIDTHVHIWELARGWYTWNTPALGALHSEASLAEFTPLFSSAGVAGVLLVQAADTIAETRYLLEVAAHHPSVKGVVGYLPLHDTTAMEEFLRTVKHREALVGVRQLFHDHADPSGLASSRIREGLQMLAAEHLPLDIPDAYPRLWPALLQVAQENPNLTLVLDHLGKPPENCLDSWKSAIRELSAAPNVNAKFSGLFGSSFHTNPYFMEWCEELFEFTLECFGESRIIFGSDWPMPREHIDYSNIIEIVQRISYSLTNKSQEDFFSHNSQRIYNF